MNSKELVQDYHLLSEALPEKEFSAENLMTGIVGSLLEHRIVQLRAVPTKFRSAYLAAQRVVLQQAEYCGLVPKKEINPQKAYGMDPQGDHGFSVGVQAVCDRNLATLSQEGTVLTLNLQTYILHTTFWNDLPGTRELYEAVTAKILENYQNYSCI